MDAVPDFGMVVAKETKITLLVRMNVMLLAVRVLQFKVRTKSILASLIELHKDILIIVF